MTTSGGVALGAKLIEDLPVMSPAGYWTKKRMKCARPMHQSVGKASRPKIVARSRGLGEAQQPGSRLERRAVLGI